MYIAVLERQLEQPSNGKVCHRMREACTVMSELLDSLLDITKLESGTITANPRDFSIELLFDQLLADNEPQAHAKGLTLRCEGHGYTLHSDPILLQRIVENFVCNAIRYTTSGGITVRCVPQASHLRIDIEDTGPGIPPDALDTIFDEYVRLEECEQQTSPGLGLGLSIARHIARLLDHPLQVWSTIGKGSTFSVAVPLGLSVHEANAHPTAQRHRARSRAPKILFIDDDLSIIDALRMLFEAEGIDMIAASCGDEALAHIADGARPDVVISDYRLPGYDGLETIRRIRTTTGQQIPAVLLTGDTAHSDITDERLTSCRLMHKPVDTDLLLALIARSCD